MSLKSIELQVAIPRTHDAGKMQDQMTKQSQNFQDTLTKQQLEEEILRRNKVNEYDAVKHQNISDEERHRQEQNEQHQKERQAKEDEKEKLSHPYLGKRIDFSG